jgi:hypothetical protein
MISIYPNQDEEKAIRLEFSCQVAQESHQGENQTGSRAISLQDGSDIQMADKAAAGRMPATLTSLVTGT